ncbi:MAG: ABC transporter permease [Cellulosilyticum sp.]|nr:ABC transporter permease [Cellulosilyticum sp.]
MLKMKTNIKQVIAKLTKDEKRQEMLVPIFAVLVSLMVGAIVIGIIGSNPLGAYHNLLQGSGILPKSSYAGGKGMLTDFMSFLNALTPLIFGALAVAVAFKTGLFNIGVSSQMLFAGFMATIIVGYSDMSSFMAKPMVLIIGMICGALLGGLIGYLKYRFNINEVVSCIMVNYIFQYVISFFINMFYVDAVSRQSKNISEAASLTLKNVEFMGMKMEVPLGIILAVLATFGLKFILDKTKLGYEMKTVGANQKAAKYAGIKVGRTMIIAMLISGALAGLAGVTYYLGYNTSIQPRVLSSVGYDSIAVSLLGNANPIGSMISAFLITIISKGSTYMSSSAGVPQEISSVITALILLFSACGVYIKYRLKRIKDEVEEKNMDEQKEEA